MIFKISRNTRIQDAQPVTFFRSRSLFSCKEITIRITKIIPCLLASPNICPFETCGPLLWATWTSGPGWRSLKGNRHCDRRPTELHLRVCVCKFFFFFNPSISNAPRVFPLSQTVSTSVSVPSNYWPRRGWLEKYKVGVSCIVSHIQYARLFKSSPFNVNSYDHISSELLKTQRPQSALPSIPFYGFFKNENWTELRYDQKFARRRHDFSTFSHLHVSCAAFKIWIENARSKNCSRTKHRCWGTRSLSVSFF